MEDWSKLEDEASGMMLEDLFMIYRSLFSLWCVLWFEVDWWMWLMLV